MEMGQPQQYQAAVNECFYLDLEPKKSCMHLSAGTLKGESAALALEGAAATPQYSPKSPAPYEVFFLSEHSKGYDLQTTVTTSGKENRFQGGKT